MGMYTFLMNTDKSLVATERINIYQREKLADKMQFIFPKTYEDIDLTSDNTSIILKYADQERVAQSEYLVKDSELYKDNYVRCELPIDTDITRLAGNLTLHVTVIQIDADTKETKVLHTSEIVLTVLPLKDMYVNVTDKSLEILDQKIIELQARIEAANALNESIDANKADDISYENNTLQLMSNGQKIGTSYVLDQQTEFEVVTFDNSEDDSEEDNDTEDKNNMVVEF